jgi:hypothetical protein
MEAASSLGFLVRAEGPGLRGAALVLPEGRSLLGRGGGATLRLPEDATVTERHAELLVRSGEFVLAPLDGALEVGGAPVLGPRPLRDGESVALGSTRLVFKRA